MNIDKILDSNRIYYATKVEGNCYEKPRLVYFNNETFIDIINDDKYKYSNKYNQYCNVIDKIGNIKTIIPTKIIYGFVPFLDVVPKILGAVDVDKVFEYDKNVKKALNDNNIFTFNYNEKKELENKNLEQTLAIIKPDGLKYVNEIVEKFVHNGLKIVSFKVEHLNDEILSEHYSHLLDKPFYPSLRDYMMEDNVIILVLEGINAVETLRNLMGHTDSTKALSGTIRGDFGTDITRNAIHGSDSRENAEIEINRFFRQKQKRI